MKVEKGERNTVDEKVSDGLVNECLKFWFNEKMGDQRIRVSFTDA